MSEFAVYEKETDSYAPSYIENAEFQVSPRKQDGRDLGRKSVGSDKVLSVSIADNTITAAMMQSNSVSKVKMQDDSVGDAELDTEEVSVTVSAGQTSGTGTCTSGSRIHGYYATGNQDQFVDSVAVAATTITITLGAAATADNTFKVVLVKQ